MENYVGDFSSFKSYATHVIQPNDPRISKFADAIGAEDEGLDQRKVFKQEIIPLKEHKGFNILHSRYVNAIKYVGTPE